MAIDLNALRSRAAGLIKSSTQPDIVAPIVATPGELASVTEVSMGDGSATADIAKDLKVPAGMVLGQNPFVIVEGTIPSSSKVANEKHPVVLGAGDRFELGSDKPLPKIPTAPVGQATYAKKAGGS